MDQQTGEFYRSHAREIAPRYETAEGGAGRFFPLLFHSGQAVLDIGAGSGRDCALLDRLGVDTWGLEPSDELRQFAAAQHPHLQKRILPGSLPDDAGAVAGRTFDGVILSAVLMHIPDAALFDSILAIRSLVKNGGRLVISTCTARPEVDARSQRDAVGRLFVLRPAEQVRLVFERVGFELESQWKSSDSFNRPGVEWVTLVFVYRGTSPRPIDRIETIINRDRKTSTYKLALLRAIADVALTRPGSARTLSNGDIWIPLDEIADLWIQYYWPIVESPHDIVQNRNGRGPILFRTQLATMIDAYRSLNGLRIYLDNTRNGVLPDDLRAHQKLLVSKVKTAIKTGPVRYAGDQEFHHEKGRLIVHADLWREFVLMGHWIVDSIILRWAELTSRLSGQTIRPSEVVDLLLQTQEDRRMDGAVREFYKSRPGIRCTWTDTRITRNLHIDHIIPFAMRKDSSLWNLVPSSSRANCAKSDKLPTLELLEDAAERIICDWRMLSEHLPHRFANDAERLTGSRLGSNWERRLFSALMETVESTATLRGVERWAG